MRPIRIAVGSGKGGTGKTTVALGLSLSLADTGEKVTYLDCDVEEPNAHLFLKAENIETKSVEVSVPKVDSNKCNSCRKCADFCEFNALAIICDKVLIFEEMCHGCGGCWLICPEHAIKETEREIGFIKSGRVRNMDLLYGELNVGEAQATPLIEAVKSMADVEKISIYDAPPGTACPFVEVLKDSDFCILVTEPTPFGFYDMKLAIEVVKEVGIQLGVVINRSDIGSSEVADFCTQNNIPILMEIPHDRDVAVAYSKGKPITDARPGYKQKFLDMYKEINERVSSHKR